MAKYFGGKDPFDDPFFTQPFDDLFDWKSQLDGQTSSKKKPITIEEINSNGDGDVGHDNKNSDPNQHLVVKKPKENSANKGKQGFSFRRVAYGGINGWYYTCSEKRMARGDEVVLAEIKEEDKIVGESMHTISKGIHKKGHSVTMKKHSDGKVDTLQTLHNLKEDELPGFEENWKVTADKYLPGWNIGFNLLENTDYFGNGGAVEPYGRSGDNAPSEKTRKIVPVE